MSYPMFCKHSRGVAAMLAATLLTGTLALPVPSHAQKYQSRLNSLLLKKNDAYLPTRLIIGEEAKFVVKAPAGSKVKVFLSSKGEGYMLPSGTPLRVGEDAQEISGVMPENGVLELKTQMPKDPELEGKIVYVEVVSGATDEDLAPIDLVDATGRRTTENTLVLMKQAEMGGPSLLPSMPGISPQVLSQLSNMGSAFAKGDNNQKQLLDDGTINRDREMDRNPFVRRGIQPGVGY